MLTPQHLVALSVPNLATSTAVQGTTPTPSILATTLITHQSCASTRILVPTASIARRRQFASVTPGWLRWRHNRTRVCPSAWAIPINKRVVQASTDSYATVAFARHALEHVFHKGIDGIIMIIMRQWQRRKGIRTLSIQHRIKVILRVLNQGRTIIRPILRIQICLNNMVP